VSVDGTDDVVATLRGIEERLRELAYEQLRAAAEDGDSDAEADERRIQQARRAVERAIRALGGESEG
jgi:hypothetical protein